MSKLPRDLDAKDLIKKLHKIGYHKINQSGSHVRLENQELDPKHRITIPYHNPIRIGTLNNILNDIADKMKISKQDLLKKII